VAIHAGTTHAKTVESEIKRVLRVPGSANMAMGLPRASIGAGRGANQFGYELGWKSEIVMSNSSSIALTSGSTEMLAGKPKIGS